MKKKHLLLAIIAAFTTFSFTNIPSNTVQLKTGTYGICGGAGTDVTKNAVKLVLNDDNTFHYIDNSDSSNPLDVSGTWTLVNNTVLLKDYQSDVRIHNKWKLDKDGMCLKSRKGMLFYRLCNC